MNQPTVSEIDTLEIANRAAVYQFLSRTLASEIDLGFLTLMQQIDFSRALSDLSIVAPAATTQSVELLAIDYCNIFIGPTDQVPPFQSVWADQQLHGDCVASMKEYLEITSLTPADSMMKDHIGLQLQVLAKILMACSESEQPKDYESLATAFFIEHVRWATPMLRAAAGRAESDFYQSVCTTAAKFIGSEESLFIAG